MMSATMKMLFPLFVSIACWLLASCSGYERSWQQAVMSYKAGELASPAGPWTGTWSTKTDGHTGKLRAIVTPAADAPGEYDFHYHATWGKNLSGTYKVRYPIVRQGNRNMVNGDLNMGVFGTFGHKAVIARESFEATYSNNKGEVGTFSMKRP